MEGLFPVYRGRVLPRGQYPLGWVSCTWEILSSVGFFPVAIPTEVRVPETNNHPTISTWFHVDVSVLYFFLLSISIKIAKAIARLLS